MKQLALQMNEFKCIFNAYISQFIFNSIKTLKIAMNIIDTFYFLLYTCTLYTLQ